MLAVAAHNPAMTFGDKLENLAAARRLDRMAVYEAIRAMGWKGSKATVHNYFAGKTRPDMDTALMLARVLGVSLDFLADDAQDEPPTVPAISAEEDKVLTLYRIQRRREGPTFDAEELGYRIAVERLEKPAYPEEPHPAPERGGMNPGPEMGVARSPAKSGGDMAV